MPDSTDVRWDADQQCWAGGTPHGTAEDGAPGRLNVPTVVLVSLVVLIVVVAVGVHVDTSAEDDSSATDTTGATEPFGEEPSGEPSDDGCADGWGGDHCGDGEDQGFFGFGGKEEEEEEDRAPDGYELRTDSNGFELHVPEGWRRVDEGPPEGVFYLRDDRSHLVQIIEFGGAHDSPQEAMDSLESGVRSSTGYSDYGQNHPNGDASAVELNYVYDHGGLGSRDVYVRTFLGGDGEVYAVLAAGPQEDWMLTRERYETAADSFCVTGHDCP